MAGRLEQAVEERLALHELLRVGLARQEDLKLLQEVGDGGERSAAATTGRGRDRQGLRLRPT